MSLPALIAPKDLSATLGILPTKEDLALELVFEAGELPLEQIWESIEAIGWDKTHDHSVNKRQESKREWSRLSGIPWAGDKEAGLDFEKVIQAPPAGKQTFCDPPYFTAKKLYGENGELTHTFDHQRLADVLKKTEHKFLLTYDDCPEIRQLYAGFKIAPFSLQYGMNNCNSENTSKVGSEIFIRNY